MRHLLQYTLCLALLALPCLPLRATDGNDFRERLESARMLYNSGAYAAAEEAFIGLSEAIGEDYALRRSELEAYRALCAIAMDRVNAEWMVQVFELKHPTAPERSMVRYSLASRLFDRGEYDRAQAYFSGINKKHLYSDWRTEFEFKRSFCEMRTGHNARAAEGFASIVDAPLSVYTYPSIYYLAYVRYIGKSFAEAFDLFSRAAGDSRFRVMSNYYCVESKFMLGDHSYVAEKGPAVLAEVGNDLKPNLSRIIAESLFSLNRREEASHYLALFRDSGAKLSRKDHYFAGILSYDLKSYKAAAESFEKVVTAPDSLSQNAWYHLANCHLKQRNLIGAMEAFKSAASLDFDSSIREDALFNFAKLSFDVNGDISQFDRYMQLYPGSGRDDVINNYMAAAFLRSKDYASAVEALSRVAKPGRESVRNLQKAACLRALQQIQAGAYRSAIPMLETSLANARYDASLENLATYWLAECLYRNNRFADAAARYSGLLEKPGYRAGEQGALTLYNLAYCYFKDGKFAEAQQYFGEYLALSPSRFDRDARIRYADACFMQNDYASAAAAYEAAYTKYSASVDVYPAYQGAVSYGLTGNDGRKIALLRQIVRRHRSAALYPQSLFELGRTYVQRGENEEASECFFTLLGMKSDSTFYAKSLLELAMLNSHAGKFEKSIDYYKTVVADCPASPEARDALSGMESIYQSLNQPEVFLAYLDETGLSSVKSEEEREKMLFSSADQLHRMGRHSAAMTSLQSFLSAYPDGPYTSKAWYLMAESLRSTGNKEEASDAYLKVMKRGDDTALAESATVTYALLALEMERYPRAVEAYGSLLNLSSSASVRQGALLGRMRAYYRSRKWEEAAKDARLLIADATLPSAQMREAQYTLAKCYAVRGDRSLANPLLSSLSADVSDAYGAEAAYLLAADACHAGDFAGVEQRVYAFSDSGTPQLYWLARSFIILGDAFLAREEKEQAEATWRSVLEGYVPPQEGDDVHDLVRERLERLTNKEGVQ